MFWPSDVISQFAPDSRIVVLTGAGMSAESGIPTFRDAQSGLWKDFRPQDLATVEAFIDNPQRVWQWYQWRRNKILASRPNTGHQALAKLERYSRDLLLVTQNVDGLHQRAGSERVVELHGNILRNICHRTGKIIQLTPEQHEADTPAVSPHHPAGLARPAVVWFGEALPEKALNLALEAVEQASICLCIGTSNQVEPAASLPFLAKQNGAFCIEINPQKTPFSGTADIYVNGTAAVVLPDLISALNIK